MNTDTFRLSYEGKTPFFPGTCGNQRSELTTERTASTGSRQIAAGGEQPTWWYHQREPLAAGVGQILKPLLITFQDLGGC